MNSKSINHTLRFAENFCIKNGVNFTKKRQDIFRMMLDEDQALSAYEIADKLRNKYQLSVPIMSIYRILDFLVQQNLVHKITSINKYISCAHITCKCGHAMPRFIVCIKCLKVKELNSNDSIKKELQVDLDSIDFKLMSQQVELSGLCKPCSK